MILLVDAGNTRIKWGLLEAGRMRAGETVPTAGAQRLGELWQGLRPEWVGVCSVAGEAVEAAILQALAPSGAVLFRLRAESHRYGILNPYADLGADRYAALVAARRRGLGHCVVAGLGTALTADALTAEGEFLGGVIAPGYGLMRRALTEGTAGVRPEAGVFAAFPGNTADAVETGILTALAGAVEGMRQRMRAALNGPVTVLLSGGDAARLVPLLDAPAVVAEDLVLEGLQWIARDKGVSDA